MFSFFANSVTDMTTKRAKEAPKKIVLIASGGELVRFDEVTKILERHGELDNVILLCARYNPLSDMDLSEITGKTDENTLFLLGIHGSQNPQDSLHYLEDISTQSFLQKLQAAAGHRITADLLSCYSGGAIKRSEIDHSNNISILTETGSKYPLPTPIIDKSITQAIRWKIAGKTNEEIFCLRVGSCPETIYYLPFANGKEAPNSKTDSSVTSEIKKTGYKFSRPGKFNLYEIQQILKDVYLTRRDIDQLIERDIAKFKQTGKTDFSINKIKKILELTNKDLAKDPEEKDSKLEFKNNQLEKFRDALKDKLTENELIRYLKKRQEIFNQITGVKSLSHFEEINYKDTLNDFLIIATSRDYEEEILAILKIKKYLDSDYDVDGSYITEWSNLLELAIANGAHNTIKMLIEKGYTHQFDYIASYIQSTKEDISNYKGDTHREEIEKLRKTIEELDTVLKSKQGDSPVFLSTPGSP